MEKLRDAATNGRIINYDSKASWKHGVREHNDNRNLMLNENPNLM